MMHPLLVDRLDARAQAGKTRPPRGLFERPGTRLAVVRLATDAVVICLCFTAAYWLRYNTGLIRPVAEGQRVGFAEYLPWLAATCTVLLAIFKLEGLYDQPRGSSWLDAVYKIATSTVLGFVVISFAAFYLRPLVYSRLLLAYAAAMIALGLSAARLIEQGIVHALRRRGIGVENVLIVGAGEVGRAIIRNLLARPDLGYCIVGFVDDDPERLQPIGRFQPLGPVGRLRDILESRPIDVVIVSLPWRSHRLVMQVIDECEHAGVQVRVVPDLFQISLGRIDVESLNGIPLLGVREPAIRGWQHTVKRGLDVVLSGLALIVLIPLVAILAVLIRVESPGGLLYRQERVGRGGRTFMLYKLRSMRDGADQLRSDLQTLNEASGPLFKIRDDPRLTRLGRWMRRLSLDEIPQLWNVLRGEMSLVGPRPPLPSEVDDYEAWHLRRLEIAPGMTGLWQVSGRSDLTFDEMVMLDLFYAENWSVWLDLKILLRTVPTVLLRSGAY
jgi:exopolysaccharide biosynthesis polyprenyl glycosylphosphotransferase